MKRISYTLLLSIISFISYAQCTVSALAIPGMTLQCNINQGQADRSGVAYNPSFDLYYSINAGSPSYPVEVFSSTGTYLMYGDQGVNFMGLWWNPDDGSLEGNVYGGMGIFEKDLYGTNGYPIGTNTAIMNGGQPDPESVGDYDTLNNEYIYYHNGSYYTYDAATGSPVDTVTITGLPVSISNVNDNSAFYIGCAGMEYGVYDYVNKRFYFIDRTTGAYVATSQLPITAPAASHFKASYANGRLWLFGTDFKWHSYLVMQNCVPPQATINFAGQSYGCIPGGGITMNANTGTGFTYQWQLGGQDIPGATGASYAPTTSGAYSVIVTENSCSQISAVTNVPFYTAPMAGISPGGNITLCENDTLTILGGGSNTLQWLNNNVPIPGATNDTIEVTSAGAYSIVASANGCADTSVVASVTIEAAPVPVIDQNGNVLTTFQWYSSYSWYLNGNFLATGSTYNATQPGAYTVKVSIPPNYCIGISAPYTFVPSSVKRLVADQLKVYPNPSQGQFYLECVVNGTEGKVIIKVTDIVGRAVRAEEVEVKNQAIERQIDLSGFNAGTYMLFIIYDGKRQVIPITVK